MSPLMVRRIIVWVISIGLGIVTTLIVINLMLPALSPNPNEEPVSIARYGYQYFFWTAFPFALIFVTILDGLLDTRIWPD